MNKNYSSLINYRPEIDGLRAIAVLSITFYHAQMQLFDIKWFEGGFIGVDVFFVISGYLITRIILSELQDNTFSLINFYQRRARRILPMLFFVIIVSLPFAWKILLPSDLTEYAKSILASLSFVSNFFFYFSATEYGANSALLKPLLHTWSLAVEEQFYLVFPILAIFVSKLFRKHFLTIFVALSLLSLQLGVEMEERNPDLNFFLSITRFWELAVGSILAYRELNFKILEEGIAKRILPMLGLYLIIYSILFFDNANSHPSFQTLIPIIGVALIISYASKEELVGKILGSKIFVWIGLISYSIYLWHFPIFAFSRIGGKILNNFEKFELILLTFILSIISYFVIEKPFRKLVSLKFFIVSVFIAFIGLILISTYIIKSDGVATKSRLGINSKMIATAQPSILFGDNEDSCEKKDALYVKESKFCLLGNTNKKKVDFLLLGDSHAMHAQPLLNKISLEHDLKGIFGGQSGCPALLGVYLLRDSIHSFPGDESITCHNFNQNGYEFVKANDIKTVFLIARWDYYVNGSDRGELLNISDSSLKLGDVFHARKIYRKAVKKTFYSYREIDVKVVVLLQVPHQLNDVGDFLTKIFKEDDHEYLKKMLIENLKMGVLREEHLSRQEIASSPWKELDLNFEDKHLFIIDPTDVFCGIERCPYLTKEYAIYTDTHHASELGFDRLENYFHKALDL